MNEIEVVVDEKVLDRFGLLDYKDETEHSNFQFKYWIEDLRTGQIFFKKIKNEYFNRTDKTLNKMKRSKNYSFLATARFF